MGRKRFITSDISTDKKIAAIAEKNPTAALMWPWFNTAFDDWGRMSADPIEVKLTVFPAFPFTSDDISSAIKLFDEHGLAHYYEVAGKPYLAVKPATWYKYQTYIDSKRKAKQASKYPAPPSPPWENNDLQQFATIANIQQQSANIVPSPSPSPYITDNISLSSAAGSKDHTLHKSDDAEIKTADAAADDEKLIYLQKSLQKGGILAPSGFEIERLLKWHEEGVEMEAIAYAIEKAAIAGNRRVTYIEGILRAWSDNNIYTKLQALEEDKKREREKGGQICERAGPDNQSLPERPRSRYAHLVSN